MVEQTSELPRFNWPQEYDPSLEKLIPFDPFFKLVPKPVRLGKPMRNLTALAPRLEETQKLCDLTDVYIEEVEPLGLTGFHYHYLKVEIFYPASDLEIFFYDRATQKSLGISVPKRIGDTRFGFLINRGIVHAIKNPSPTQDAIYVILSNMLEEDALKLDDVISCDFELPSAQPLESLLKLVIPLK